MLASVTHELKTPLNTIYASVEQLLADLRDEKDLKNLKWIKASVDLMLSLIGDIIDNAKLDEGNLDLQEEPVVISDLFQEMQDLFEL